jgi:hypothetical protein
MSHPTTGTTIAGQHLAPEVMASLREAASRTGINFDFLVAQASLESGFKGSAQAAHTTAAGLFQFTSKTWLAMMHEHGAKYGQAALAHEVKIDRSGSPVAASPEVEKQILDLRRDVKLSAYFAAEYAKTNAAQLEAAVGHKATPAELHLAHLLGPNGAIRFLKAHDHNAQQAAAKVVPQAARQNPSLFYSHGRSGVRSSQSVASVYKKIQEQLDVPMRQVAALESEPLRQSLGLSESAPRVAANAPASPRRRTDHRA